MSNEIKNIMETLVDQKMDHVIETLQGCSCPRCRMDVVAWTLNQLPARYVVTKKGELYAKAAALNLQYETDILTALAQAVELVKANPRHNQPS